MRDFVSKNVLAPLSALRGPRDEMAAILARVTVGKAVTLLLLAVLVLAIILV